MWVLRSEVCETLLRIHITHERRCRLRRAALIRCGAKHLQIGAVVVLFCAVRLFLNIAQVLLAARRWAGFADGGWVHHQTLRLVRLLLFDKLVLQTP